MKIKIHKKPFKFVESCTYHIITDTPEKSLEALKILHGMGLIWTGGSSLLEHFEYRKIGILTIRHYPESGFRVSYSSFGAISKMRTSKPNSKRLIYEYEIFKKRVS